MNLEGRKISLVQELLRIDNEKLLVAIENLLSKSKTEIFEENLQPMSSQDFKNEIDKAVADEENNKLVTAKDLEKNIQKWS